MARLRVAVVGVGHLGKEHARILSGMPEVELVGVVDTNIDQAQTVALRCNTTAYSDYWPLFNLVDAAVVAVPTCHHFQLATEFLRRGIPLLVEKPLAANREQAEQLCDLARQAGVVLQVGHIERFNPAFEELQRHPLQPKYIDGQRVGTFTGRSTDIGVVLDMMIHDIDLVLALVKSPLRSVDAMGLSLLGQHEDVVNARLGFANGCVATLSACRAAFGPARRMQVWSPEGYAQIDFAKRHLTLVQPSESLRCRALDVRRMDPATLALFREQLFTQHLQVHQVECNRGDQLTMELTDFVTSVREGTKPRVAGEDGLAALGVAERILQKVHSHAWEGTTEGAMGPLQVPHPLGRLFEPRSEEAAA